MDAKPQKRERAGATPPHITSQKADADVFLTSGVLEQK